MSRNRFVGKRPWAEVSNPNIVADVSRLVDAARVGGHDVVWILHADAEPEGDSPFDPASGFVRLLDGLDPAAGEPVTMKTSRNAFTTTNLAQRLTGRSDSWVG